MPSRRRNAESGSHDDHPTVRERMEQLPNWVKNLLAMIPLIGAAALWVRGEVNSASAQAVSKAVQQGYSAFAPKGTFERELKHLSDDLAAERAGREAAEREAQWMRDQLVRLNTIVEVKGLARPEGAERR